MIRFWEVYLLLCAGAILVAYVAGEVTVLWYRRWRKWKSVRPHYGSVWKGSRYE